LLRIGGGVGALVVIGGLAVAGLTLSGGSKGTPTAAGSASASAPASAPGGTSASSGPSASASPSASHFTQPVYTATQVFSAPSLQADGATYTRALTKDGTPCWRYTMGGLGAVLTKHICADMLRATYVSGGHAVTVGIAVFHSRADASAAAASYVGQVVPLYSGKVASFCTAKGSCAVTHGVYGRFLYIADAGPEAGAGKKPDAHSTAAGRALAAYALSQLEKLEPVSTQ